MLETNPTGNNATVLGGTPNGSLAGNSILQTANMQSNITPLAANGGPTVALGGTSDRLDASSDSAVSSMGSERVPSLSDGEWGDGGSDSAQDYHNRFVLRGAKGDGIYVAIAIPMLNAYHFLIFAVMEAVWVMPYVIRLPRKSIICSEKDFSKSKAIYRHCLNQLPQT